MQNIVYIAPDIAITGQLEAGDIAEAARLGFRGIVNNRVENEEEGQLPSHAEAALAWRHGIAYRHVPAGKLDLFTDPVIAGLEDALANLPKPILLHCKSGMRSAIVWAAAAARRTPVESVLAALEGAGFELDFLRDELDAQADRHRWMPAPVPTVAEGELAA
ncbi:MAG: beta-lactamase hydrolase domain-containing protein [Hyphomicrobiaceae bacterium]